jgi:hypothetical protein
MWGSGVTLKRMVLTLKGQNTLSFSLSLHQPAWGSLHILKYWECFDPANLKKKDCHFEPV